MKLRLAAPAKINWTLEVLRRRDGGYHDIRSLLQTLALHDVITLSLSERLEVRHSGLNIGPAENDLVLRAAEALRQEEGKPELGALIELEKVIPVAAGLGGGSSDGAATLRGLNRLWRLGFDEARLVQIGAGLGSDVSFFLCGGSAVTSGRGDEVESLPDIPSVAITVAVPEERLPQKTARMYARLRPGHFTSGERTDRLISKLKAGETPSDPELFNVFEAVLPGAMPSVVALMDGCHVEGAFPHLAGAGPAFFFLSPLSAQTQRFLQRAGVTLIETTTSTRRDSTFWEEM